MLDGDLDPQVSKYTLVPLKVAYKKLRLLVDSGCIFIGHGLSKDFRTISTLYFSIVYVTFSIIIINLDIFVPPDQVIDTVDLYFLPEGRRKLSLRFLSWFILGEDIQAETHDSIEDARSALMLFKAYHGFEGRGVWEEKLEELYREGRQRVRK
jgi:PAB-dependent poly(A)-specific ribonuclease subunit 2